MKRPHLFGRVHDRPGQCARCDAHYDELIDRMRLCFIHGFETGAGRSLTDAERLEIDLRYRERSRSAQQPSTAHIDRT